MDLLFILLVLGAIVATAIGYVIWIVFFVWAVKKGVDAMQKDMNRAQGLIQTYRTVPTSTQAQMKPDILQLLANASTHLQQMDNLRRQQYEVKVGELHSMAAQAGIDWTPPPY
jgi:cytoskeletal protein RodZ